MSTMQNTVLVVRHPKSVIPNKAPGDAGGQPLAEIAQFLESLAGGFAPGRQGECEVEIHRGSTDAAPARARGTIALSGASGNVVATINGVTHTVATGASDAATMTLLVAAIMASADALVANFVRACNMACTVALASLTDGQWVTIDGVRFTARVNPNSENEGNGLTEFDIGASDTASGDSLVARVNAHPTLREKFFAINAAGTVTLRQLEGTVGLHVFKEGAGITLGGLTSGLLTAVATGIITSTAKLKLANAITTAASGTGASAAQARLTGGVGGDSVAKRFIS